MKVIHQTRPNGTHRIVIQHEDSLKEVGFWALYDDIAVLDDFRAVTDYWDGTLPRGVFRVLPVESTAEALEE